MDLDPNQIARLLPFEERYERRRQRWYDGPHGSWEAFDHVLEREVVLNIPWAYTDVTRFIRSAKVAASFRHPAFLPVYDLGIVGDTTPFYTTPLAPGESLGQRLRRLDEDGPASGPVFPILWLVGAVRDACRALEHAHQRGLLHLNLRPESLLVGDDDRIILDVCDWEPLGRREGDEAEPPTVFGFPYYMSPEQIAGTVPPVGPATDVFGLGGILHVILFGTPPNRLSGGAGAVEVLRGIVERTFEPRRPGMLRPGIRSSSHRKQVDTLVAICMKALAFEPEARYPTPAKMGEAIDECEPRSRTSRTPWPWWR